MKTYRLSEQASTDLRAIWDYISEQSLSAADRMIDGLFSRFRTLAREPLLGEARNDLHPGLRASVFKKFLILYYPMQTGSKWRESSTRRWMLILSFGGANAEVYCSSRLRSVLPHASRIGQRHWHQVLCFEQTQPAVEAFGFAENLAGIGAAYVGNQQCWHGVPTVAL
jgi:plasmid stabilization system protein ParE